MSYDYRITTALAPETAAVRAFLGERLPDATIEGAIELPSGQIFVSVLKRSRPTPVLMIDAPAGLEPEDVEDEVVDFVLAPRWLSTVNVPGDASAADLRLAKALAAFLAREFRGVAFDPQDEVVLWPKKRVKAFSGGGSSETIDVVEMEWQMPYARRDRASAEKLIETLRTHCFECLPRRFGLFEPFQGKTEGGDFGPFLDLWEESAADPAGELLHFASTAPCFGGSVSFSDPRDDMVRAESRGAEKTVSVKMSFDGRALADAVWRNAAVGLFTAVARNLNAFHAIAYVERDLIASRNRLAYTGHSERYPLPGGNRWHGIPPVPAWLTWFGPPYAARVRESCGGHITGEYPEGFLMRHGEEPAAIDALLDRYPALPVALLARLDERTVSRTRASGFNPPLSGDKVTADEILSLE